MSDIETVIIERPENERSGRAVINASEFDPKVHTLAEGQDLSDDFLARIGAASSQKPDDPTLEETQVAEERKAAAAEYREIVGKQPGPKWDAEKIREELEAFKAQQAAAGASDPEGGGEGDESGGAADGEAGEGEQQPAE